jgi:uncharacterized protein (DUF58 family)
MQISPQIQRQLDRLMLRANRWLPGDQAGHRASPRTRPAFEFIQHRKYVPGDDIRFVDWRASARSEHVYLREGEHPQAGTLHLLVDVSASMGWGQPPKNETSAQIAAMLAYVALNHGDRFILLPYRNGLAGPVGPLKGKGQIPVVMRSIRRLSTGGEGNLYASVQEMQNSFAPRGGMLVILSDLLGVQDLETILDRLPYPQWSVTVLHLLHPEELIPVIQGDFIFEDVETGQTQNYDVTPTDLMRYQEEVQAWIRDLELVCRMEKAFYVTLKSGASLESEILPTLRQEGVLVPR